MPLIARPPLDPLASSEWSYSLQNLWAKRTWVMVPTPRNLPDRPVPWRISHCMAREATKNTARALSSSPIPTDLLFSFECNTTGYCEPPNHHLSHHTPDAAVALHFTTELEPFAHEFMGPAGMTAHTFWAGACAKCESVHWFPGIILTSGWTRPEDLVRLCQNTIQTVLRPR